jgi:hypothetical protein
MDKAELEKMFDAWNEKWLEYARYEDNLTRNLRTVESPDVPADKEAERSRLEGVHKEALDQFISAKQEYKKAHSMP